MNLDAKTKKLLADIYPDLATRWIRVAEDLFRIHDVKIRVTDALRSAEDQADRYAQGRTAPGQIVTYSRPGDSFHLYGLALDSCFMGADPYLDHDPNAETLWREYGRFAAAHGLTWGGSWSRFVDRPHVQLTYGLLQPEVKELYAHKGIPSVWAKCDQMRGVEVGQGWA